MLQVKNLSFGYHDNTVLKNINFTIKAGEHLSIIGESGSGKSTMLKLIYGEYDLDYGTISWKNEPILGPSHNLVIGYPFMKYVAQEFDLMPFITVEENIGKYLSNFYPEKKQQRIKKLIEVVELTHFAKVKVKFLSGGQKQRVALAKALAKAPEILLLDEPFSHIDNFKKQSLRRNIFKYLKEKQISCIVATHDKDDVLGHANNMLVLHEGKQLTYNKPKALYNNPEHPLVASFFGEFNDIDGQLIYAHQLKVVENSGLKATVTKSYFKGNYYLIEAISKNNTLFFQHHSALRLQSEICLEIAI